MKKNILILFLWIICGIQSLTASDLHCIMIADTQAIGIGVSVVADIANIRSQMKKISDHTGMKVKETIFEGIDVNADLLEWIDNYQINNDDAVLFFFSGHGYRNDSKKENPWPNLYLTPICKGVDYSFILEMFLEKKPRFFLAIADCCNNMINEKYAPHILQKRHFLSFIDFPLSENYCQLFKKSSGYVIATSASPGQFAWGGKRGGLFTKLFFESLETEVNSVYPPDWRIILEKASISVIHIKSAQIPQYEINVNITNL